METITTAMTTAFGTVATDATTMLGAAIPAALGIAGIVIVVRIGWKIFKSVSKG